MEPRPKRFLVWGAGGHGRVVGELVRAAGHRLVGYVDKEPAKLGRIVEPLNVPVSHPEDEFIAIVHGHGAYPEEVDACTLGVGNNLVRLRCLEALEGLNVPPLIHPSAMVSPTAYIGRGSVIFPQAVVNTGAWVGDAVIVNSGGIIEHDCVVESAVHVSPGAVLCGGVRVGARSWIGAGSIVIHGITIGRDAITGAGSTVIHDVNDEDTVVGSPAKGRVTK